MTESEPSQEMPGRKMSAAAFAPNWKTVLAVDAGVGLLIALIGVAITLWVVAWLGSPVIGLGVLYLLLVGRRALQWRYLRREAGLHD